MSEDNIIKEIWNRTKEETPNLPVKSENQQEHDRDYNYVGKKLREFIDDAENVLEEAKDVAVESGEARSFEAYANLLKVVGKLTKDVMESSKDKAIIDKTIDDNTKLPGATGEYKQTNIFVGTTKELAEMIKQNTLPAIENDTENNV